VSFVGARQAADFEAETSRQNAEYQRALAERNAARVDLSAAVEEDALKRDRARRMSTIRATAAAFGGGFEGSPLEVEADSAAQVSRDLTNLRYNFAVAREDALIEGYSAVRRENLNAQSASIRGRAAYGSLLGGFADAVGTSAPLWTGELDDPAGNPT
jgi:hypothetical protein